MFTRIETDGYNVYTAQINEITLQLTVGSSAASLDTIEQDGAATVTTFDINTANNLAKAKDISSFLGVLQTVIQSYFPEKSPPGFESLEEVHDLIANNAATPIPVPLKLSTDDVLRDHWDEYSPALQKFINERLDSKQTNAEQIPGFSKDNPEPKDPFNGQFEDPITMVSPIEIPVKIPAVTQVFDLRELENNSIKDCKNFKNPLAPGHTEREYTRQEIQPARDFQREFERAIADKKPKKTVKPFTSPNIVTPPDVPSDDDNSNGNVADQKPEHSKLALTSLTFLILTIGSVLAAVKYPQETSNFFKPVKDTLISPTSSADLPVIGVVGIALAGLAISALAYYFYKHPCPEPLRGLNP